MRPATMKNSMRTLVAGANGPEQSHSQVPTVADEEGSVLVRVRAAALNRIDLHMSRGGSHGSSGGLGAVLGVEFAGEIVALGPGVTRWRIGDRVMGSGAGAFAEYKRAPEHTILPIPTRLTFAEAAALPVGLQTMHNAIATVGAIHPEASVLIQGASSGMGILGLQIARHLGATMVIGTSTTAARRERLTNYGAHVAVDSGRSDWVDRVQTASGGTGVDLLIDLVAGPMVNDNQRATRIGGRIVNVGRVGGESGDFDFDLHSYRRLTYTGVTFRTVEPAERVEIAQRAAAALLPAVDAGTITAPVNSVVSLSDYPSAFAAMESNSHFGKIVLDFI